MRIIKRIKKKLKKFLPRKAIKLYRKVRDQVKRVVYRVVCRLFVMAPIRSNKIVFDNYMGKGFGCNTKYAALKLLERGADRYDLVWLISGKATERVGLPPQIRVVRYGSLRSLYEYVTAKIWVSNYHKISYIRKGLYKRSGQYFIQMWHGSLGIKKLENDVPALTRNKRWLKAATASSRMTDFWISNSDFETGVYKTAFWDIEDEKILLYGHPRNDIFFNGEMMRRARAKVDAAYGLEGKKLLLYAPTFREDYRTDCYGIDQPELLRHLEERFGGDWAILMRLHPRVRGKAKKLIPPGTVNATYYVDIQELLAAADCLVTDYSSCAFDFMLTGRPVFLFATDVREYDQERGFYYPLESTPFPLAHDNGELMQNVDRFDEADYGKRVKAFLRDKGCVEDGRAGQRVAELIEKLAGPGAK